MKKIFLFVAILLTSLVLCGCSTTDSQTNVANKVNSTLTNLNTTLKKVNTISNSDLVINDIMDIEEISYATSIPNKGTKSTRQIVNYDKAKRYNGRYVNTNDFQYKVLGGYVNKLEDLHLVACDTMTANNQVQYLKTQINSKVNALKSLTNEIKNGTLKLNDSQCKALTDLTNNIDVNISRINLSKTEVKNELNSVKSLKTNYVGNVEQLNSKYTRLLNCLDTRCSYYSNILGCLDGCYNCILGGDCNNTNGSNGNIYDNILDYYLNNQKNCPDCTQNYCDENGNCYYCDENGNCYYCDKNGNCYQCDENGNCYQCDENGNCIDGNTCDDNTCTNNENVDNLDNYKKVYDNFNKNNNTAVVSTREHNEDKDEYYRNINNNRNNYNNGYGNYNGGYGYNGYGYGGYNGFNNGYGYGGYGPYYPNVNTYRSFRNIDSYNPNNANKPSNVNTYKEIKSNIDTYKPSDKNTKNIAKNTDDPYKVMPNMKVEQTNKMPNSNTKIYKIDEVYYGEGPTKERPNGGYFRIVREHKQNLNENQNEIDVKEEDVKEEKIDEKNDNQLINNENKKQTELKRNTIKNNTKNNIKNKTVA